MSVPRSIAKSVADRANGRCEYCRTHESIQVATFHIEHVIPPSRGGSSELQNLAWACPRCNLHKSDRVAVELEPGEEAHLFNPRLDNWEDHFAWQGFELIGRTRTGQATIKSLQLNHPRRIAIRQAEQMLQLFPPDDL